VNFRAACLLASFLCFSESIVPSTSKLELVAMAIAVHVSTTSQPSRKLACYRICTSTLKIQQRVLTDLTVSCFVVVAYHWMFTKSRFSLLVVANVSDEEMQEHYDNFFEDVFVELEDKYGEIEEMNVCDNLGDHLVGNVYIKFRREEDAERAVKDLNNRWFGGRPVYAELSPVTDFREACCRQYEMGECTRSGFCNFMHLKPISRELRRHLYSRRRGHSRSRSRSPNNRRRSRSPRGGPGGNGGGAAGVRREPRERDGRRGRY